MDGHRNTRRASASTHRLVDRIAGDRDLLARIVRSRFGYSRRDIQGPTPRRNGPAVASKVEVAG